MSDPIESAIAFEHDRQHRAWQEAMHNAEAATLLREIIKMQFHGDDEQFQFALEQGQEWLKRDGEIK